MIINFNHTLLYFTENEDTYNFNPVILSPYHVGSFP